MTAASVRIVATVRAHSVCATTVDNSLVSVDSAFIPNTSRQSLPQFNTCTKFISNNTNELTLILELSRKDRQK